MVYKSKPCLAFRTEAYCPYGVRCSFDHEVKDLCNLQQSYFSKSLLLTQEARVGTYSRRLPVFASIREDSE